MLPSDLKVAVDLHSACLDLPGDIQINDEELDYTWRQCDYLVGSCGATSKDNFIFVQDDVRVSDKERCAHAVKK